MAFTLSRRRFLAGSAALASAGYMSRALARTIPAPLPVPPLVDGSAGEPVDLTIRSGEWSFLPGIRTSTVGFNQDYLGPTLRTRRNSELALAYRNTLSESVALHGHGLHVPGSVDGGPQLLIAPNCRPLLKPALTEERRKCRKSLTEVT